MPRKARKQESPKASSFCDQFWRSDHLNKDGCTRNLQMLSLISIHNNHLLYEWFHLQISNSTWLYSKWLANSVIYQPIEFFQVWYQNEDDIHMICFSFNVPYMKYFLENLTSISILELFFLSLSLHTKLIHNAMHLKLFS